MIRTFEWGSGAIPLHVHPRRNSPRLWIKQKNLRCVGFHYAFYLRIQIYFDHNRSDAGRWPWCEDTSFKSRVSKKSFMRVNAIQCDQRGEFFNSTGIPILFENERTFCSDVFFSRNRSPAFQYMTQNGSTFFFRDDMILRFPYSITPPDLPYLLNSSRPRNSRHKTPPHIRPHSLDSPYAPDCSHPHDLRIRAIMFIHRISPLMIRSLIIRLINHWIITNRD
jgi:hypothetical protein